MRRYKRKGLFLVLILAAVQTAIAQSGKGAGILSRCMESTEGVKDYTVNLNAEVDMEGVRIPRMEATMYFKKPNKVHFESPDFAMLPREGFGTPISQLRELYHATLQGEEMLDNIQTHKLHLVAKDPATRLQQLYVWVDKSNWTVVRTESVPYQGRSVKMDFTYALQDGRYWLPSKMKVELKAPPQDTTDSAPQMAVPGAPQLGAMGRARRSGTITVEYSGYRINTGLSDDLFKPREMEN